MDNLTHTLVGVAISQTGLNRKTRFATLTLILTANAPDIDIFAGLRGSINYLKYHRGITHSLFGITVLALIFWGLVCWLGNKVQAKPALPLNRRWLLLAAFLGTSSHLLLDFTNAYGVRPFLPFSGRWYAWDIMAILDPLLLALLIGGLAIPWLLRVVSEEVGASKPRWGPGAVFGLCAMLALWGIRDFAHRRALSILDSHTYDGEIAERFSALPVAVNPFAWTGVLETESSFRIARVNALDAGSLPEDLGVFEKPQMSPPLHAAVQTRAGKIFLDFARFPWAQVDENERGYLVRLCDLRFYHSAVRSRGFTLDVELDKSLETRSENFYFSAPPGPGRGD